MGLPYTAVDYFGLNHDVIEEADLIKDALITAEVIWEQVLNTGMSVRSRIPIKYRAPVSICIGLRLCGVVFSFKTVSNHFDVKQSSLAKYFNRVSHWKQPEWITFNYDGDVTLGDEKISLDGGSISVKLPLYLRYPEIKMGDVIDTFSIKLGKPELSSKAHMLYMDYIEENEGIGGRSMNVFAAALILITSGRNKNKISQNAVSSSLGISKKPIRECVALIKECV